MSPPCGAKVPERKTDPKFSTNYDNGDIRQERYQESERGLDMGVNSNDDVSNNDSGSGASGSEPVMNNNGVNGGGNGNGNGNSNSGNGNSNNGNGNGNGNGKHHSYPTLYPTRGSPSRHPSGKPSQAPTVLPIPVFVATVTEHASDKNDPYLLATEPLIFPLNPRGTNSTYDRSQSVYKIFTK